jgi:hypothetical protein
MNNPEYLAQMCFWYFVTIAIETTVLIFGLSSRHPIRHRIFAGIWLTAATYPVVWLVFPKLISDRTLYLWVAETFAPIAECALFWLAFGRAEPRTQGAFIRDMATIVVANLASFVIGYYLMQWGQNQQWESEWIRRVVFPGKVEL